MSLRRFLGPLFAVALVAGLATPAIASTKFFGIPLPPLNEVKKAKAEVVPAPTEGNDQSQEGEAEPQESIDPREITGAFQDTREQLKQVNELMGVAGRLKVSGEFKTQLSELKLNIVGYQKQLKDLRPDSDNAREVLDAFHEENYFDAINKIRQKLQLPKEIADIGKGVTDVEKVLGNKQLQKAFTELGVDAEKVKDILASMKEDAAKAKDAFNAGNFDDADDALADIRDGGHPSELLAILNGARRFYSELKAIRDTDVRGGVKDLVKPIISSINSGDIREARLTLDEMGDDIERALAKASKLSSKNRQAFLDNLQKIEDQINQKLEKEGANSDNEKPENP